MTARSEVFFADIRVGGRKENKVANVGALFDRAGIGDIIAQGDLTAVKIHFGERGNEGFISPVLVRPVVEAIKGQGGKPFITDSNTLYTGSRHNAVDHLETAIEHGFTYSVTGAPILIADGLTSRNYRNVYIGGKHFERVRISADILDSDSLVVMSHFKGHEGAGFGGALKNLSMGCSPAAGKRDQHSSKVTHRTDRCIGCGRCAEVCPVSAITMRGGKALVDLDTCIGCGQCIDVCPTGAMTHNWDVEHHVFLERMMEYALGAVKDKGGKAGYMSFLLNITPHCDCFPYSDAPIVPDIGILASRDPVAIDAAAYDLVNEQTGLDNSKLASNQGPGEDKFKGLYPHIEAREQLRYAEGLGLGTPSYDIVRI